MSSWTAASAQKAATRIPAFGPFVASEVGATNDEEGDSGNAATLPSNSGCLLTHSGAAVNIRTSPEFGNNLLSSKMYAGEEHPVLDQNGDWFQVQLSDGTGWVSGTVTVLRGECSDFDPVAPVVSAPHSAQPSGLEPIHTGVGQSMRFEAGQTVVGYQVAVEGYQPAIGCYLLNPPAGGMLTDGTIFPPQEQYAGMSECQLVPAQQQQPQQQQPQSSNDNDNGHDDSDNDEHQAPPPSNEDDGNTDDGVLTPDEEWALRRTPDSHGVTDDNGNVYVPFEPGDEVVGDRIEYNDGTVLCEQDGCYTNSAPQGGRVYGGTVDPVDAEVVQYQ